MIHANAHGAVRSHADCQNNSPLLTVPSTVPIVNLLLLVRTCSSWELYIVCIAKTVRKFVLKINNQGRIRLAACQGSRHGSTQVQATSPRLRFSGRGEAFGTRWTDDCASVCNRCGLRLLLAAFKQLWTRCWPTYAYTYPNAGGGRGCKRSRRRGMSNNTLNSNFQQSFHSSDEFQLLDRAVNRNPSGSWNIWLSKHGVVAGKQPVTHETSDIMRSS